MTPESTSFTLSDPPMRQDGGVGTRILTVEDDERIRTSVKLALEDEGWVVVETDSGEQALESFSRAPTDVVLIDIMLPGIDGFEVCRSIRKSSDVPIIMVTARNDTHDIVAGLEAGADDYLTKPFAPKELSARIRALLRRVRTSDHGTGKLAFGDLEIIPDEGVVTVATRQVHLTKTEFRLPSNWPRRPDGSSVVRSSWSGCGATGTSATAASSTSTSGGSARRSSRTPPTPATW